MCRFPVPFGKMKPDRGCSVVTMMWRRGCCVVLLLGSLVALTRCTTVAIVGGGAAVGSLALRDKTLGDSASDTVTSARIAKAIYKVSPDAHARVGINVQEGEVLLTGALPTEEQRVAVEAATWSVPTVKKVYNNIELSSKEPIRSYAQDAWITSQIKTKLLANASIRSVNFSVKTVNHVVYIFGIARNKDELAKVTEIASRTRGVARVMSYIRLKASQENNLKSEGSR